jgi:hypothetical protein
MCKLIVSQVRPIPRNPLGAGFGAAPRLLPPAYSSAQGGGKPSASDLKYYESPSGRGGAASYPLTGAKLSSVGASITSCTADETTEVAISPALMLQETIVLVSVPTSEATATVLVIVLLA